MGCLIGLQRADAGQVRRRQERESKMAWEIKEMLGGISIRISGSGMKRVLVLSLGLRGFSLGKERLSLLEV